MKKYIYTEKINTKIEITNLCLIKLGSAYVRTLGDERLVYANFSARVCSKFWYNTRTNVGS